MGPAPRPSYPGIAYFGRSQRPTPKLNIRLVTTLIHDQSVLPTVIGVNQIPVDVSWRMMGLIWINQYR